MKEKVNRLAVLTKGIIKENPNLVLLLGTCPTLATTSSAFNGMGMGIAATAVLICSNIAISLLAKLIPDKVRIPCYIVLIAGFVTLVQFIVQAFAEPLYNSLGVFLPLIVVNCIILGRAEAFASKNGVLDSALDGLGMGLGYTLAVLAMSFIRELISTGGIKVVNPFNEAQVWLNLHIIPEDFTVSIFGSSVGAFITFAVLAAAVGAYKQHVTAKEEAAAKEEK